MDDHSNHEQHEESEGHVCDGCGECEHGDGGSEHHPAAIPAHDAAPHVPRFERPDTGSLVRAIALLCLSIVSFYGAVNSLTHYGTIMAPVAGVLGTVGMLSMWGALIHITGGERFDDHPWV